MKYFMYLIYTFSSLFGAESFDDWLNKGEVSGYLKYYYIETNKNYISGQGTSAHSNAVGGQLHYNTARINGLTFGTTFMTTQGFLLADNVESSTLGQDEGKRGDDASDAYSVLGEIYLDYTDELFNVWYGRRLITTPMIGPKKARMLPSTVEGGHASMNLREELSLSVTYVDKFKQRSANHFTNIVQHALGDDMLAITGVREASVYNVNVNYKTNGLELNFYDTYAVNFLNTMYADISYKKDFYSLATQFVSQQSIGNADSNLAKIDSLTKGKKINSRAIGIRGGLSYKESSLDLVYRNILRNSSSYDSIITPWDGELLYAYSTTTNNLGQSLYGNGLTAGGAYVGGTEGVKFGFTQTYNFLGLKGFKTHLAYAMYANPLYRENQEDLKAIIFYDMGNISLQLKGIWIDNDTYTFKDGTVNQLDSLTQYHAILTYKF